MDKVKYRPRFIMIVLIAVIIGQLFSINYLKKYLENSITQCYEAINTSSIMQAALINILVEKKIVDRSEIIKEAQILSADLRDRMEKMTEEDRRNKGFEDNRDQDLIMQ